VRLASQFIPEYRNPGAALTQAAPLPDGASIAPGLRDRKKERTRLAIRDAALELFAEHGYEATTVDEIAERAEVSKATFFRYFATKGEVIFTSDGYRLEPLADAIAGRPAEEHDFVAAARAIRDEWVPTLEPRRIERQTRAAATSPLLRGLSFDLAQRWQDIVVRRSSARFAPDPVADWSPTKFRRVQQRGQLSGCSRDAEESSARSMTHSLLTDVCRESALRCRRARVSLTIHAQVKTRTRTRAVSDDADSRRCRLSRRRKTSGS
jgi:AcrR family transcriptional regulator